MIASGSQYIQLFTSSPDILHLAWGQEKKKSKHHPQHHSLHFPGQLWLDMAQVWSPTCTSSF